LGDRGLHSALSAGEYTITLVVALFKNIYLKLCASLNYVVEIQLFSNVSLVISMPSLLVKDKCFIPAATIAVSLQTSISAKALDTERPFEVLLQNKTFSPAPLLPLIWS
jgi:hypothetical protein